MGKPPTFFSAAPTNALPALAGRRAEPDAATLVEPIPEHSVVQALAALAQPSRLRVFRLLVVAGPLGLTPGALSAELGVAAATLSFHLKELVHAGLVSQQRDGRNLIYRAAYAQMNAVLAYLTQHCCQGEACLVAPQSTSVCC